MGVGVVALMRIKPSIAAVSMAKGYPGSAA
jgi:hypothetical protein